MTVGYSFALNQENVQNTPYGNLANNTRHQGRLQETTFFNPSQKIAFEACTPTRVW